LSNIGIIGIIGIIGTFRLYVTIFISKIEFVFDTNHMLITILIKMANQQREIRIGMLGNVDAGKTTITGVLIKGILDDGRGLARTSIMRWKHEKVSGRTTCPVQHHIKKTNNDIVSLTDLAGHEKYLKNTIGGIKRCFVEYVGVVVAANKGILPKKEGSGTGKNANMTREHLSIVNALNLPAFFILTKIDMVDNKITKNAIQSIKDFYSGSSGRKVFIIRSMEDIELIKIFYAAGNFKMPVPIFPVSSVTGAGIDLLKHFITEILQPLKDYEKMKDDKIKFVVDSKYMIPGIGRVVSGILVSGTINASSRETFQIGPIMGKFYNLRIGTMHNNFKESISVLYAGQSGCIQLKSNDIKLAGNSLKKGIIITQSDGLKLVRNFIAEIQIMMHHTSISKKYQPLINCGAICQCAEITDIKDVISNLKAEGEAILRSGDRATVQFQFKHHPEAIEPGEILIFREGRTRGVGKVLEVF